MARRTREGGSRRSRGSKTKRSIDFSQEVLDFEGDMEYPIEVKECKWEDGEKAPYLAFVFKGVDDEFAETTVYHNASTAPRALSRTRTLLEALGYLEEGADAADIDSDELVGLKCMGHTFFEKDQNGTPRIRFDDFWPLDDGDKKSSGKGSSKKKDKGEDIDYDDLDDADIKKLAKKMGIKGRDLDKLREELADEDQDEVREAAEELDIDLGAGEPDDKKSGKKDDEDTGKRGRGAGGRGSGKSKKKQWTEEEINDMSEDELETVVEESSIDIDLDDFKTLRKKKNAVIDALTEAELLAD